MDKNKIYESLSKACFSEQCHEKGVIDHLPELLKGVKVFADVGAGLGQYTYFANKYIENGLIIAIEADPVHIEDLTRNCSKWESTSNNKLVPLFAAETILYFSLENGERKNPRTGSIESLNNIRTRTFQRNGI